jgi:hypothetical protein
MRVRKLLKIGAISLASLLLLGLLGVAAFVFNPFEGNLADMRDVVPPDVDIFLRKTELVADFGEFPEPAFWESLSQTEGWRGVRQGPTYAGIDGNNQASNLLARVRDECARLRKDTMGYVDVLADVLGREVIVAGRFTGPVLDEAAWCAYARVSWTVKFAWGMLGYGFVQEKLAANGVRVRFEDEFMIVEGDAPLFLARVRDCMMVANDRELLRVSHAMATGMGGDSLGGMSGYRDGVVGRVREWQDRTGQEPNALEFYLRPLRFFERVKWDDNWPDPKHPTDMNSRVLASFVSLRSWLFLSGALLFEPDSVSILADLELNQNEHTPFQGKFFRTEAMERDRWLDPFLSLVPEDACAAAAMRMPAGDFLVEMYQALDQAERDLLDERLKMTGKYEGVPDLLDKLALAFQDRIGFVFRRKVADPDIKVANPAPVPHIAWVFWLRDDGKQIAHDFVETVSRYRKNFNLGANILALGLTGADTNSADGEVRIRGDAALEFTNPQIPGTGSFAVLFYDQFFVISNSGPMIRAMFQARMGLRNSIRVGRSDLEMYRNELPNAINGFVYVQARELRGVLEDYQTDIRDSSRTMDPEWAIDNRSRAEAQVFRAESKYARHGSLPALPKELVASFEADVEKALAEMWRQAKGHYTAGALNAIAEVIDFSRLFRSAYLQVILEPRHMKVTGRALAEF